MTVLLEYLNAANVIITIIIKIKLSYIHTLLQIVVLAFAV